jgi:hypothetical protein
VVVTDYLFLPILINSFADFLEACHAFGVPLAYVRHARECKVPVEISWCRLGSDFDCGVRTACIRNLGPCTLCVESEIEAESQVDRR